MAAPIGNRNGAKAKIWSNAIMRAIDRKYGGENLEVIKASRGLDKMADEFLELAYSQSDFVRMAFFKEVGDRIEGKVAQPLEHSGDGGGALPIDAADGKNDYEVARRIATALTQAALSRAAKSTPAIASTARRVPDESPSQETQ